MGPRTHKKRIEAQHAAAGLSPVQIRAAKNARTRQRNAERRRENIAKATARYDAAYGKGHGVEQSRRELARGLTKLELAAAK